MAVYKHSYVRTVQYNDVTVLPLVRVQYVRSPLGHDEGLENSENSDERIDKFVPTQKVYLMCSNKVHRRSTVQAIRYLLKQ
jgi:hypothetical protein